MHRSTTLFLLVVAFALTGCGIRDAGPLVTEDRQVGAFDGIRAAQGLEVVLDVDPGNDHTVTVVYAESLIDDVLVEVQGSTLVLTVDDTPALVSDDGRIEVTAPSITSIEIDGGASVEATGTTDGYFLIASGGASIDLFDLDAASVELEVDGGASVDVTATASVTGSVSGGSNVEVKGSPANARVDNAGGSTLRIEE